MKKLLLLIAFTFLCLPIAQAQTQLKWNALYWAFGVMNMSVETKLAAKWSFNGDIVYSPWESISGNPMKFGQAIAEGRYYPKGALNGFFIGGYAGYHKLFKFTKWNYINSDHYQKGDGISLGATLGYQININNRWAVDIYAGYGWQHSEYKGYVKSTGEMNLDKNGSGEWLPYKIGAAFVYRLGKQ